jgi:hypothetical protein
MTGTERIDRDHRREDTIMTATIDTQAPVTRLAVAKMPAYDFYVNPHKAIRSALLSAITAAGSIDPADGAARAQVGEQVRTIAHFLDSHAEHEDKFVVPVLETHAPQLAEVVRTVHPVLDARVAAIRDLTAEVETIDGPRARGAVHGLYLDLSSFTSAYLDHQDFEERQCMPALLAAVPIDELIAIEQAIVASIPPADVPAGLSLMLPAMNVDDRVEFLGGMRAGAPPEVFAGACALAQSVLTPAAWSATASRLGLD